VGLVVVGLTPIVLEGLVIRHLEAHRKDLLVETVLLVREILVAAAVVRVKQEIPTLMGRVAMELRHLLRDRQ